MHFLIPFPSNIFHNYLGPDITEFQPPSAVYLNCQPAAMVTSTPVQSVVTVYRTRPILGPLTTEFTAPPDCSFAGVSGTPLSIGWLGQTCVGDALADASTCWPPATPAAPSATTPLSGWGFYSPGISCPAGHTTACYATHGFRTGWDMQYTMEEGETAVGCCPTYVPATSSLPEGSRIKSPNVYLYVYPVDMTVPEWEMAKLVSEPSQMCF